MRNHFDVLGVERAFHLDRKVLEGRFLELSKRHHPDRFAKAAPRERLEAITRTTELNDAYRVLKDDVKRAEYLCKLEGLDVAEEKPPMPGQPDTRLKADPALLMAIMELREELAEAKGEGDEGRVEKLTGQVRSQRADALQSIEGGFTRYEQGDKSALAQIAQALIALRYYGRFMEEVETE